MGKAARVEGLLETRIDEDENQQQELGVLEEQEGLEDLLQDPLLLAVAILFLFINHKNNKTIIKKGMRKQRM